MKKNMLNAMDRLDIDEGIRGLVRQLWKHCYKTVYSCDGHGALDAYVLFKESGDGWFEANAQNYGFAKVENKGCCAAEFEEEIRQYGLDPSGFKDQRKACSCGAGVNGYVLYKKGIKTKKQN